MRMLRGQNVLALVELSSRPMRMKFGMGERPDFRIVSWHVPGLDMAAPQLSLGSVEPATSSDVLDDKITY